MIDTPFPPRLKFSWNCPECGRQVADAMALEEASLCTAEPLRLAARRECLWCQSQHDVLMGAPLAPPQDDDPETVPT